MPIHFSNARILTMHPPHPRALTLTIDNGRILTVDQPAPTGGTVVDCRNGVLLPGFIDPHVHLLAAAAAQRSVDCSPRHTRSIAQIQDRLRHAAASTPDGWIRAAGYDESALTERRHPTRWDLDEAVPGRPVRLQHRSGHAVVFNSLALSLAGITIESEEPPGGMIDRRLDDGEPTGLLIDMDSVVERTVTPLPFRELVAGMRTLSDAMLQEGVTAVQDLTHRNDASRLALLDQVLDAARFAPRRLPPATVPELDGTGPVKLMLPEASGLDQPFRHHFHHTVQSVHQTGRQLAIHATTEAGLSLALDAIDAALAHTPRSDHRHRIEHAAIAPPELIHRAVRLGVVVVSNPIFLHESGARYRATVPPHDLPNLYPVAALIRNGVTAAAASDTPVARPAPLDAIYAATARRDIGGTALPGATVGPEDALTMVTRAAAFAAFAEARIGSIAPGMTADLVLLDRLPSVTHRPRVLCTLIDGAPAFRAEDAPPFP